MLTDWLQKTAAPQHPPVTGEPIQSEFLASVQTAQQTLQRFFATPDACLTDTLRQFAHFAQGLPDAGGQQQLWRTGLEQAIAVLDQPLIPAMRAFTEIPYVVFSQVLLEQLAASIRVWRVELLDAQGCVLGDWTPLSGPMNDVAGAVGYRVYQQRKSYPQTTLNRAALIPLLAPKLLPPDGLDRLIYARQQGLDWPCRDMAAPHQPADAEQLPTSDARTGHPPAPTNPKPRQDLSLATALQTALQDVVSALIEQHALNHLQGSGWVYEDALYLVGKAIAAALRQHPALVDQASHLQHNTVVYRALLQQQISARCGAKPIWTLVVSQNGQQRKVAAIKIPLTTAWRTRLDPLEPFTGDLTLPGQRRKPSTRAKTAPDSVAIQTQSPARPGYTTLFDEH
ncbi:MAG: hypothetical protein KDK04_22300 [Candidatus Competibacteraceae bacterium]|nr:hypothetical protein [Candidatus Competibacteraceae bacterium]